MKPYVIFLSLLAFSSNSLALDVAKAYRLIPHEQTPFYISKSNLPKSEANYIATLLTLSELAMAERVEAMMNGARKSNYDSDIEKVLDRLANLKTPSKLKATYQHIVTAVEQHQAYFALTGSNAKPKKQQLVQSSHQHLIAAYNGLMQLYPQETRHNKQAFFDYLCALDFI